MRGAGENAERLFEALCFAGDEPALSAVGRDQNVFDVFGGSAGLGKSDRPADPADAMDAAICGCHCIEGLLAAEHARHLRVGVADLAFERRCEALPDDLESLLKLILRHSPSLRVNTEMNNSIAKQIKGELTCY